MTSIREDILDEDVRRMYEAEGMTQRDIADYYGVAYATIYYRLHPEKRNPKYVKKLSNHFRLEQPKDAKEYSKQWRLEHPEYNKEACANWYQNHKEERNVYQQTGFQGLRHKIRMRDNSNKQYQWLKCGLGKELHIHHEWIPETDKYSFSALVDASEHMHNIIKPIIILEDNRIILLQDCDTYTNITSEYQYQRGD